MELHSARVLGLLIVPLTGAVVVAALGPRRVHAIRWISLAAALLSLSMAFHLTFAFAQLRQSQPQATGPLIERTPTFKPEFVPGAPGRKLSSLGGGEDPHATSWEILRLGRNPGEGVIHFYLGIDGLNIWMVLLTAVLFLPSVLISWNHITERVNEFYAWLMVLQVGMFGVFLAFDIILFYAFFELSLVPLFFLIGVWGGSERRYAARKFFIYTLTGSLITFLGVLGIVIVCYFQFNNELTFSLPQLVEIVHKRLAIQDVKVKEFWGPVQFWVFLALMTGFAVKVPLVPFHTWLPLAHVEAPTAGSVDLAGVLLKVGAYGFLRLCLPLAPDVSLSLGLPLVSSLAAIGILYGAFCAYSQNDIKRLVAYSSVSHLGLCMLGMFALNVTGLSGSLMQMINHGLSTAALFLLVGMLYERYHTRQISDFGGMAGRLPLLSLFMVFIVLTSIGLPGLNGFIGEILVLMGVYQMEAAENVWPARAVVAALGMILGAWYLLTMVRRTFFGPVHEPHHEGPEPIQDLSGRELAIVGRSLALMCLFIGVYPKPILDASRADIEVVAGIADRARARAKPDVMKPADANARADKREP